MIVLLIILGFGLTIFVHELGHFLAARWAGVQVKTFCIGMGPRLFRLYRDKKGTDYIIAMLPIGGYVEMLGQQDVPTTKAKKKPVRASDYEEGHYLSKTPLKRLVIIVAGVVMNVLFAYILIVAAFSIGVPFLSNKVGGFMYDSKADDVGLQRGDEIVAINGQKVHTWEDMITKVALLPEADEGVQVTVNREGSNLQFQVQPMQSEPEKDIPTHLGLVPYRRVMFKSSAGSDYKEILDSTQLLSATIEKKGLHRRTPEGLMSLIKDHPGENVELELQQPNGSIMKHKMQIPEKKIFDTDFIMTRAVVDVVEGGGAAAAGLQDGDEIVSINETQVLGWNSIVKVVEALTNEAVLKIAIRREGTIMEFSVKATQHKSREGYFIGVKPSLHAKEKTREVSYISPLLLQKLTDRKRPKVGDTVLKINMKEHTIEVMVMRDKDRMSFSISKLQLT